MKLAFILGYALFTSFLLYHYINQLIVSTTFINAECSGVLVRPSYWLTIDASVGIFCAAINMILFSAGIVCESRRTFTAYGVFNILNALYVTCWLIVGGSTLFMKSSSCDLTTGNHMLTFLVGSSIIFTLINFVLGFAFAFKVGIKDAINDVLDHTDGSYAYNKL